MSKKDADVNRMPSRRTVLSSISGVVGATALSGLGASKRNTDRQYVGKTYDPLTDKEQADASAVLNFTSKGVKGTLNAAGFEIPVGQRSRVREQNSHPGVNTYTFKKTASRFTVTEDGEELPIHGRIDLHEDRITGTLTRPSGKYGKIAFSLNPTDEGFSAADVGRSLRPESKAEYVPGFDQITVPNTGIPTSNSIRNAPTEGGTNSGQVVADGGTLSTSSSTDKDVGFLDSYSGSGSISDTYPDRCSDTDHHMSWTYEFGTSSVVRYDGSGNVDTNYDEITENGGYKRFQMQSHFSEVPDPFTETCDQQSGVPYQVAVEFWAHQTNGTTQNDTSLSKPYPNDDTSDGSADDGIMNLALGIVNDVSGVYGSVASTLIKYALSTDSSSDVSVTYNGSYSEDGSSDQEEYYWDLSLDGYESDDSSGNQYFPDHTDNVAGASFKVHNGAASGKDPQVETRSRFEWGYLDYYDGSCPCETSNTVFKTMQSVTYSNYAEYHSVTDS